MTFYKLLLHDLRCGLLRWHYFLTAGIAGIPLLRYFYILHIHGWRGTFGDCLLFLFRGEESVLFLSGGAHEKADVPILWMYIMGCCLLMHMGYFLRDLTGNGQYIMVRSYRRRYWFAAKCLWSAAGAVAYALALFAFTFLYCAAMGQRLSLAMSANIAQGVLGMPVAAPGQVFFTTMVKPVIALVALNLLQMVTSLLIGPIGGFLLCAAVLLLAVYLPGVWLFPCGAMALRNIGLPCGQFESWTCILSAAATIAVSCVIGVRLFVHMDILPKEEH